MGALGGLRVKLGCPVKIGDNPMCFAGPSKTMKCLPSKMND